eukprot:TRINITY_DN8034_c2_g1_i1.p1 TRINITY_DN8034_c2_g1~~TRINITY_DN8034_c2_g1_i1.p1  ORF type:complete len:255 (+),score=77.69 TRINITY_DN8034_c2_g1_i1:52-765(+)
MGDLEDVSGLLPTYPDLSQVTLYRCLRQDEVEGLLDGGGISVQEPAKAKLPGAHVNCGSRAKTKSTWVSFTRSLQTAEKWARKADSSGWIAVVELEELWPHVTSMAPVRVVNPVHSKLRCKGAYAFPPYIDFNASDPNQLIEPVGGDGPPLTLWSGMGHRARRFCKDEVLVGENGGGEMVVPPGTFELRNVAADRSSNGGSDSSSSSSSSSRDSTDSTDSSSNSDSDSSESSDSETQ